MADPCLLRHARIADATADQGLLVDLLIEHGRIAAITAPGALPADGRAELDAADCAVLPGLVNAHTHAHGALARGAVPDRISLEGFLARGPALNGGRSLIDIGLSARLSAVELLHRGCTAAFDMAAELPVPTVDGLLEVAKAYQAVGLRAVVAPMLADRSLYEADPALLASLPAELAQAATSVRLPSAQTLLAVCREAHQRWPFDRTQIQLGLGPTIPLHCSDALLQGCAAMSAEFGLPLQTHLAESKLQALVAREQHGESPVRRLARLGCLSERTSAAHSVWLDDDDIALLAQHRVVAVHNPGSNLRLGSGLAPLRRLLQAGVRVGLGTDASNTGDGQNVFEAMRLAALLSRLVGADWSQWLDAEEAFALATQGSAQALGLPGSGRLEVGAPADLVFISLAQPHFVPLRHLLRQLVFAESGSGIRRVMVNGRTVLLDGRVLGIDEAALRREAEAAVARLQEATTAAREFAQALNPWLAAYCCAVGEQPFAIQRRLR
jgi:guanine deaminase